jgi:hypothetical protein
VTDHRRRCDTPTVTYPPGQPRVWVFEKLEEEMSKYGFEMFADVLVYSQAFLMTRLGGVKDFLTAHGPFPVLWVDSVVGLIEIF